MADYKGEDRRSIPPVDAMLARLEERFVRIDERTERMDRDIRQMMSGQSAQTLRLESMFEQMRTDSARDLEAVRALVATALEAARTAQSRADNAHEIAARLDSWFIWALRLVVAAVVAAVLYAAGLGVS